MRLPVHSRRNRSAALGRNPTRHSIPISDWLYWLPIKARTPQPSGRNAMEPFISKHAQAIIGTLSGFDRLVFRGTLRFLAHCAGMSSYLWTMGVLLKDFLLTLFPQPILRGRFCGN